MNKEEKKLAKENSNLIEFTLNEINKNELDENSPKKSTLMGNVFEIRKSKDRVNDGKKVIAADTIKNFWITYRAVKRNTHLNRYEHYRRLMYETNKVEEEKVEEYVPIDDNPLKGSKPEDNFNQLLSQLSNESDHEATLGEMF
jgi:hypothetical protein